MPAKPTDEWTGVNPDAVANRLILTALAEKRPITPLQIQKHVYLAHGWHLGILRRPLIDEHVEAWKFGPVIPSLWGELRQFGDSPITDTISDVSVRDGRLLIERPDVQQGTPAFDLINAVWERHKNLTASQLVALTHAPGTPWHQVASMHGFKLPPRVRIPNELIEDYYAAQAVKTQVAG